MMRNRRIGLGVLLLAVSTAVARADERPVTTAPAGESDRIVRLFNGRNLDGFYKFLRGHGRNDPAGVFAVRDGLIHVTGPQWGCLTTEAEYENYRLIVEYRWGEQTFVPRLKAARDNGIIVHSQGRDGAYGNVWMFGIEVQLIEGGTGDLIIVGDRSKAAQAFSITAPAARRKQGVCWLYEPGGAPQTIRGAGRINWWGRDPNWTDVIDYRGRFDVENPRGEWNRLDIVARGAELAVILNDVLVNHAVHVTPQRGRIQIQAEGAEIFFRRIDLHRLDPPATSTAPAGGASAE